MNWFRFYPGDWQRDTRQLSLAEQGAYLVLIQHYYSTEQPLPSDPASLYRIAGAQSPAEKKAVRRVLDFFELHQGAYRHKRVDEEIVKACAISEKNRRNRSRKDG